MGLHNITDMKKHTAEQPEQSSEVSWHLIYPGGHCSASDMCSDLWAHVHAPNSQARLPEIEAEGTFCGAKPATEFHPSASLPHQGTRTASVDEFVKRASLTQQANVPVETAVSKEQLFSSIYKTGFSSIQVNLPHPVHNNASLHYCQ